MATSKKTTLVLLDTHAIIHRAYHALPEFMNSKGEPTGAMYGLATMVFKIISELDPDYIIACYDLPKKTFRHEAYADYKGGRAKTDDALIMQLIKSRDFFKACSVPMYECEGFEADDLLGTIANKLFKEEKNIHVIIASGDMDTMQLVEGNTVEVYTLKKGINDTILYNETKVVERFGFKPIYLPDYKGLRGDPSDNIIGIKGIGEKTATTLISNFGTIENIYKELKKDSKKISSLGITPRIIDLLTNGEDEALFSKTLATIRRDAPIDFVIPEKKWKEAVEVETVSAFFKDMEFKSLQNRFLSVLNIEINDKKEKVEIVYSNEDKLKIKKSAIAFWLLNSEKTDPNLEDFVDYRGSNSLDEAYEKLQQDISKEKLDYVYKNIELPLIPVIEDMEQNGVLIDKDYLKKLSKDYHVELSKLEQSIWKMAPREFNINSPKQLGEVIFDEMNLSVPGLKKSKGGARSTRESELEKLRDENPIIGEILKYRELQKLLSTYIDTLPSLIKEDGRLHAHFIQAGTTTGRFSSSNPNVQNIPVKTDLGKNIRHAFVAPKGSVLVSFDYSQIELRIAALLSQDEYFINVFNENQDIHAAVASRVFGVKEEDVTSDMRRRAKVINFGILYGMGVTALKDNLGTTRKEAQIFYDNYFAQFPTIASYLDSIKIFAKENGYTETLFGRKRYFPGIKSPLPFIKAMNERMAINAPIQGTAADVIKIGMIEAQRSIKEKGLEDCAHLVLQVHDELIYEVKKEDVQEVKDIVINAMQMSIPIEFLGVKKQVPLIVSFAVGDNWGLLK